MISIRSKNLDLILNFQYGPNLFATIFFVPIIWIFLLSNQTMEKTNLTDQQIEKIKRSLRRTPTERFFHLVRLIRINKMLKTAVVVHQEIKE